MTRLRLCVDDVSGHTALDTAISRVRLERVDAAAINRVLTPVCAALDPTFDAAVTGQLSTTTRPISFEQVRSAIATAFRTRFDLQPWALDAERRRRAEATLDHHLPTPSRGA